MPRWHLACDHCDAGAWVGPSATGLDGWCESCQSAHGLPHGAGPDAVCPDCGIRLSTRELRFEELFGELRNVAAVLAAWDGDPGPLHEILAERPRLLTDLKPPEVLADDPPGVRGALEALQARRFPEALLRLEAPAFASALVGTLLGALARESFLRSPPAAPLAAAVLRAAQAAADHEPGAALREVRALMARCDVRGYRVPYARCGRGSVGVDGVEEVEMGD